MTKILKKQYLTEVTSQDVTSGFEFGEFRYLCLAPSTFLSE